MLRTQESLRILPDRTGGRTVVNTNAPDEKIPEIFRESEAYYLLGFERDPTRRPTHVDRSRSRSPGRAYARMRNASTSRRFSRRRR